MITTKSERLASPHHSQCVQHRNEASSYACCHPLPAGATVDLSCMVRPKDGDLCKEGEDYCVCTDEEQDGDLTKRDSSNLFRDWLEDGYEEYLKKRGWTDVNERIYEEYSRTRGDSDDGEGWDKGGYDEYLSQREWTEYYEAKYEEHREERNWADG